MAGVPFNPRVPGIPPGRKSTV
jgi:hypothetical protein